MADALTAPTDEPLHREPPFDPALVEELLAPARQDGSRAPAVHAQQPHVPEGGGHAARGVRAGLGRDRRALALDHRPRVRLVRRRRVPAGRTRLGLASVDVLQGRPARGHAQARVRRTRARAPARHHPAGPQGGLARGRPDHALVGAGVRAPHVPLHRHRERGRNPDRSRGRAGALARRARRDRREPARRHRRGAPRGGGKRRRRGIRAPPAPRS